MKTSFYGGGDGFNGRKTASGETFNAREMTAAHQTYPFGTQLKLTNPENGKTVTVRVNDRGPFSEGRDLDVSHAAAKALDFAQAGTALLQVEVLSSPAERPAT